MRKLYERSFVNDLKAFDSFSIEPTYSESGRPTQHGLDDALEKEDMLRRLVSSFKDMDQDEDEAMGNDLLHRGIMSPFWKTYGRPVFNITPELAAALIMTDLPGKIEDNPPFPAFILSIQVPLDGTTPLVVGGTEYFGLSFFCTDMRPGESWCVWAFPRWETQPSFYQKIPYPRAGLHDWVREHPECVYIHRLLVNLFAYIRSKKVAGQLSKPKKVRLGARKGMLVTSLGKDIRLSKNLIYAARGETGDPKYKLAKRFAVRGHWRNQPYGKKVEGKTRETWIMPHWKGPDILEATERTYTVE